AVANAADGGGFSEVGDPENVGAALHEQPGDLLEAVTISVRLHDGNDFDLLPDAMANPSQVLAQSVQIDLGPAAVKFVHVRVPEKLGAYHLVKAAGCGAGAPSRTLPA